jgi:hypothetical protein
MCTVEDIIRMKKNGMKRARNFKRIRIRRVASSMSIRDLEAHIEQLAEEENAMSRYEHSLEVA